MGKISMTTTLISLMVDKGSFRKFSWLSCFLRGVGREV